MIFLKSLWNVVPLYEFFYAVYRLSEAHQFFEILEENHFWRCSIFAILKTLIDLIQTLFKTSILSSYLVLKPSPLVRIKLSVAPNENVRCGLKKTIVSYLKVDLYSFWIAIPDIFKWLFHKLPDVRLKWYLHHLSVLVWSL